MGWKHRCFVRSFLRFLPFISIPRRIKRNFEPFNTKIALEVLERARFMVEALQNSGVSLANSTAVELGPGWLPILPLFFRLAGCDRVIGFDKHRLLERVSLLRTIAFFKQNETLIGKHLEQTPKIVGDRLRYSPQETTQNILDSVRFQYHAPCDACSTQLDDSSVDVVFSHTVLEHIPPPIISSLLKEFHRILKPGGVMCHFVDCADHWCQVDRSISAVNFLQYSEKEWKWTTHYAIDYQNRLRVFEYRKLMEQSGFLILIEHSHQDAKSLASLDSMQLAPCYSQIDHTELAKTETLLIARKA